MPTAEAAHGPPAIGARRAVLIAIVAAACWAFVHLGLGPADVIPDRAELQTALRFFSHALSPALEYESAHVPAAAPSLIAKTLDAAWRTVILAAAAMGLSVVIGVVLGFAASTAWWSNDVRPRHGRVPTALLRAPAATLYVSARVLIAFMRSIHELLWAVLFLAAMGLGDTAAVIAIAIPYGGTLAKVFSEMIDEAPRDAAAALRDAGAGATQIYLLGLVSRTVPDMGAYTLYRFECALRSSAIVGFFGPATLGKFIRQSWDENLYGEVWTYLYALFVLIAVVDWWSGAMRRRFVS